MPKLHNNQFRHIKNKLKQHSNVSRKKAISGQMEKPQCLLTNNFPPKTFLPPNILLGNIYKDYNVLKNYGEKLYWLLAGFREMDLRANRNTLQRRKFELELEVSEGGARLYSMQLHRPNFNFDFSPRFQL